MWWNRRLTPGGPGRLARPTLGLLLVLAVLLAACAGGDDDAAEADAEALACERVGYPCTWDEVDGQVVDRGFDIADELAARLAEDHDAALVWLAGQEGVAEARADERGVRLRLDGGRPVWVLTSDALVIASPGAPLDDTGDTSSDPEPDEPGPDEGPDASAARPGAATVVPAAVVGDNPGAKSALALSPFRHEWPNWDDARRVADILGSTRDYEGNVTYLADDAVTIDAFTGWDAHEVVIVATHGMQLCRPRLESGEQGDDQPEVIGLCETVLDTGMEVDRAGRASLMAERGLDLLRVSDGPDGEGRWSVGLGTDFFRGHYPGGLDETIVLLSACQTAMGSDLVGHLAGSGGVALGWSENVRTGVAYDAAVALVREMTEHGVTTEQAMETLREQGLGAGRQTGPSGGPVVLELIDGEWVRDEPPEQEVHGASLRRHQGGDDLRIREVVTLQHPHSGAMLRGGERILVERRADADYLPLRIEVDGVLASQEADFVLELVVEDGEDSSWTLADPEVTRVDDHTVVLVDEVPLDDEAETLEQILLEATVTLPEGGHSVHRVEVVPVAGLTLRWEGEWTVGLPGGPDRFAVTAEFPLDSEVAGDDVVYSGSGPLTVTDVPGQLCRGQVHGAVELVVESLRLDRDAASADLVYSMTGVTGSVTDFCGFNALLAPLARDADGSYRSLRVPLGGVGAWEPGGDEVVLEYHYGDRATGPDGAWFETDQTFSLIPDDEAATASLPPPGTLASAH